MEQDQTHKRIDDLHADVREIRDSMSKVTEVLVSNTVTLERNTKDMEEHMRRTDLLETQIQNVQRPVLFFQWFFAGLLTIGGVLGLYELILSLIKR